LYGRIHFPVIVECDRSGRTITRTTEIDTTVAGGLRAFPDQVRLPSADVGVEIETFVDLFDAYPDDALQVKGFESSNAERLRVDTVADFEPTVIPESIGELVNPRAEFKHRYRLRLTCRTPAEHNHSFEEYVNVAPQNPEHPQFRIRVVGRTRSPDFEASPRQLVIAIPLNETSVQRRLELRGPDTVLATFGVLDAPDFVRVSLTGTPHQRYAVVTLENPPDVPRLDGEITLAARDAPHPSITVPITVFRLPAASATE
jgi:hypothetical protein